MVTRYLDTASKGHIEFPTGPWVKYEDYASLELKVLAALSHLERASEAAPHMTAGYVKMALRTLKSDN